MGESTISQVVDNSVRLTESYISTTGRLVTKEIIMYLEKRGDR